jgi:hypothetical protein
MPKGTNSITSPYSWIEMMMMMMIIIIINVEGKVFLVPNY